MAISRLSDLQIEDPILRAVFYQRVMDYISVNFADLNPYTIKIDEAYRYDLASMRAFNSKELAWLVALVAGNADMTEPLPIGETLYFPSAAWVRQDMREFIEDMGLDHAST